jgi:hypothetical protein
VLQAGRIGVRIGDGNGSQAPQLMGFKGGSDVDGGRLRLSPFSVLLGDILRFSAEVESLEVGGGGEQRGDERM